MQIALVPYRNLSGDLGVRFYEIGDEFIRIWFADGEGYEYDAFKPGGASVERMKQLAAAGQGLATFINQTVRKNYARKL